MVGNRLLITIIIGVVMAMVIVGGMYTAGRIHTPAPVDVQTGHFLNT